MEIVPHKIWKWEFNEIPCLPSKNRDGEKCNKIVLSGWVHAMPSSVFIKRYYLVTNGI